MCKLKQILLGLLFISTIASASTTEVIVLPHLDSFFEVDLFTGPTGVTGGFSDQKNPNSYGFSLNVYFQSTRIDPFPSYISFGNYNFSMVSKDNFYPFPVGESVMFSSNFMNIMLSVYNTHKWGLYVGVGYSLISLLNDENKKFQQTYGSQQYEVQLRYALNDRWGLNYRTKWQQINQYQNGNFSFIEMWSHFMGASYIVF